MPSLQTAVTWSIACSLAYLASVAVAAAVAAIRAGGRRDDPVDHRETLAVSRFTIPVSVVVPVSRPGPHLDATIAATLALNYPEFEVAVVLDGAQSGALDALIREWELEPREFFYRRTVETAAVRRIYRSRRDSRLMVIDKSGAGYSDALNCGVNVARYRYVVPIAPDLSFDTGALLRLMSPALGQPATVVGVSNHVEDASRFERLASIRAQMESRLVWRALPRGLGPSGAVVAWRRDAVLGLRGFSSTAADPELDMMFRLQTSSSEIAERIDRRADVFGRRDARPLRATVAARVRRQRAALQIVWLAIVGGRPTLGLAALSWFVASELLTPWLQAWVVVAVAGGAASGWFAWSLLAWTLVLLSFGNAVVSVAALLLRGTAASAPDFAELARLFVVGPFEFVLYRPAIASARALGLFTFGSRRA